MIQAGRRFSIFKLIVFPYQSDNFEGEKMREDRLFLNLFLC